MMTTQRCVVFSWILLTLVMAVGLVSLAWGEDAKSAEKLWADVGFGKPKIEYIDSKRFYGHTQPVWSQQVNLTLVLFRDSGWGRKVILERLQKMANIYSACGIGLGRIKLVEAGAPDGIVDFTRPGTRDQKIAQQVPPTDKPIFFYFRSIPEVNAYSWPESTGNEDIGDAIKNTAWFSLSVTLALNKKIRHPDYVSEAHELGHLLLDSEEHTAAGMENLMGGEFEWVNDQLTGEQCTQMKKHHLLVVQ